MWRADRTGASDWFNGPWFDFTGRSAAHELGYGWIDVIHPADRPEFLRQFAAASEKRRDFSVTVRLARHDGIHRWVAVNARVLSRDDGSVSGFLGYCEDVTERREAERRLMDAIAKQDFLLDEIRHRVRNTMQVIVGFVHLLNRRFGKLEMDDTGVRIEALARMQQYFYATPERACSVRLADFLREVAGDFARPSSLPVHVEVAGPDVLVDIGQATSIGLAVTEALLNGADPERQKAGIQIGLQRSAEQLMVSIERLRSVERDVQNSEALRSMLELYARLVAGTVEITDRDDSTTIVLKLTT